MKYNKKYLFAACAALLLGMQSCDLEEYNPAGSTPDNVYKEQAGFEALVNSAYAFWGGQDCIPPNHMIACPTTGRHMLQIDISYCIS